MNSFSPHLLEYRLTHPRTLSTIAESVDGNHPPRMSVEQSSASSHDSNSYLPSETKTGGYRAYRRDCMQELIRVRSNDLALPGQELERRIWKQWKEEEARVREWYEMFCAANNQ
ncbi:hypothetical protein BT69DRAFT_1276615 [Atractiella rhizophila]|nr:hypothetical protein BT69DRAFT_1276615 [Atractiella rhizophila]